MTIDITLAAIVGLIGLFVLLGSKVWSLASKVEGAATKDGLALEVEKLRNAIGDKSKESVEEHKVFARRSDLLRIEDDLRNDVKELRSDMKEQMLELNKNYKELLASITGLASQVTAEIARRERDTKHG